MLLKNMMNILLGVAAVGIVLVGYNAFVAKDSEDGRSASDRLASHLFLAVVTVEQPEDIPIADLIPEVGVGDGNTGSNESNTSDGAQSPESGTQESTGGANTNESTGNDVSGSKPEESTGEQTGNKGDKAETVYTVKEGDTYGCIAEKYYGSFEHFTDVMNVNPVNTVGFTEYGLFVGAKITLPAIKAADLKPASNLCG